MLKSLTLLTAWEAQIDLEEFTERDIEQEVQILIVTNQNMDPDPAETEKENPVTTTTAMKMARYLRSYLQSNSGSLEQLQCLSVIENKLMKDKLEDLDNLCGFFHALSVQFLNQNYCHILNI